MGNQDSKKIELEARRIEEAAKWSAQGQFEQAKIWRKLNVGLGGPTAIFATVSGVTALSTDEFRYLVASSALIAAGLSAIMTTLNLARRIEQAQTAANAYLALQQDARILWNVDLAEMGYEEARAALAEVVARQQEINKSAPIPSKLAYALAGKNIKKGGQVYEVDNG